ncbi:MAG TPA: ABC transporter permease [Vicinamibacterales bacterium]
MDDVRLALRRLVKHRAATLASIVALAVSIGAAAATWALLSAVLVNPLPVRDADRLFVVGQRVSGPAYNAFTYHYFPHIRDAGIFEHVTAEWTSRMSLLVATDALPTPTPVSFVSHDYLDVLGIPVRLGRGFTVNDDRQGAGPVALLTDRYWRETFNASPDVLGRTLHVNGTPVTVIGVIDRGYRGLGLTSAPEILFPFHIIKDLGSEGTNYFAEPIGPGRAMSSPTAGVGIIVKLAAGITVHQASERLNALGVPPAVLAGRPAPPRMPEYVLTNVNTAAIPEAARDGMAQFSKLLAATVGLLLLIGCGAVGMLLLVRTEARRDEFAMCLALGATRLRLAFGIVIEGALLALAGATAALPVAHWFFAGARSFDLPGGVPIALLDLAVDSRTVGITLAAALLATLSVSSIAGAFGLSANLSEALRSRSGATPRTGRRRTRAFLVSMQVAVALVLLAGAGLFARSLVAALTVNPGFDAARLLTTGVDLRRHKYSPERAEGFFAELDARLRGNPALAAYSFSIGMGGMTPAGRLTVDGLPRGFPSTVSYSAIDDRYFDTMGLAVLRGRSFNREDRSSSPRVAIVSESFGRMLADGGDPLGMRITMPFSRPPAPPDIMEVVGVVPDVITNVTVLEPLTMYFPLAQHPTGPGRALTLRASADPDAVRREMMAALRQIDPAVTPAPILTIEDRLGRQMSAQQFGASVLGALGLIAVLLTVLGTYVLAESMAVLRMREMGIRAALGATRRQLAAIVLAESGRLVGLGLAAGLFVAWLSRGLIESFLFRVEPLDPATLATVAGAILALALLVSVRPALRAAGVDLGMVLKEQ